MLAMGVVLLESESGGEVRGVPATPLESIGVSVTVMPLTAVAPISDWATVSQPIT